MAAARSSGSRPSGTSRNKKKRRSTLESLGSAVPLHGPSTVEDIIFKYILDVVYDPAITSRRRRLEWPALDSTLEDIYSGLVDSAEASVQESEADPKAITTATRDLLDEETSKCNTRNSAAGDEDVFDLIYYNKPEYFEMLQNLYWRARRQSTIWDCFTQLVVCDFVSPRCLEHSVYVTDDSFTTPDIENVIELLKTFHNVYYDDELVNRGKVVAQTITWCGDITWLAIMIVRGGKDLLEIFIKLVQTDYLGAPRQDLLQEYLKEHGGGLPTIQFDLDTVRVDHHPRFNRPFKVDNSFGFILPHGIGSLLGPDAKDRFALTRNFYKRFNAIEEAYRNETGLPREKLLLEREEVANYEEYCI